jgi:hypothetical protein
LPNDQKPKKKYVRDPDAWKKSTRGFRELLLKQGLPGIGVGGVLPHLRPAARAALLDYLAETGYTVNEAAAEIIEYAVATGHMPPRRS